MSKMVRLILKLIYLYFGKEARKGPAFKWVIYIYMQIKHRKKTNIKKEEEINQSWIPGTIGSSFFSKTQVFSCFLFDFSPYVPPSVFLSNMLYNWFAGDWGILFASSRQIFPVGRRECLIALRNVCVDANHVPWMPVPHDCYSPCVSLVCLKQSLMRCKAIHFGKWFYLKRWSFDQLGWKFYEWFDCSIMQCIAS